MEKTKSNVSDELGVEIRKKLKKFTSDASFPARLLFVQSNVSDNVEIRGAAQEINEQQPYSGTLAL